MPSKRAKKREKSQRTSHVNNVSIVGPNYIQLLTGRLLGKHVSLILCGESHEDAIDVTRSNGNFTPLEGWVRITFQTLLEEEIAKLHQDDDNHDDDGNHHHRHHHSSRLIHRVLKQKERVPLEKAKEWATQYVNEEMVEEIGRVFLVWAPPPGGGLDGGKNKGKAFVLLLDEAETDCDDTFNDKIDSKSKNDPTIIAELMNKLHNAVADDDDDDNNNNAGTIHGAVGGRGGSTGRVNHGRDKWKKHDLVISPEEIVSTFNNGATTTDGMEQSIPTNANTDATTNEQQQQQQQQQQHEVILFEWGDLDPEAQALNHLRLLGEEISVQSHDALIEKRKNDRKEQNIWTWDDWFAHIKRQTCNFDNNNKEKSGEDQGKNHRHGHCVHLVLEASIPPWEVELHREEEVTVPHAAECIRCLPEDSDADPLDESDPSSDGFGSYLDFVYRKFMEEQMADRTRDDVRGSNWFHCVDSRDLGCEDACVTDSLHVKWRELLLPEERSGLWKEDMVDNDQDEVDTAIQTSLKGSIRRILPKWKINPEDAELEKLRRNGLLRSKDDESEEEDDFAFTFPSFEGYFGQNTDITYYSPHVNVGYSPFMAKCVGSSSAWEEFFTLLFFGGTIPEALSKLTLKGNEEYIHIRSPIFKEWDKKKKKYKWRKRNDDEYKITFPFLPVNCYLKAKDSVPPRTWSSQLFSKLTNDEQNSHDSVREGQEVALRARDWALDAIKRHSADPKGSDYVEGGGEWFLTYLHAAHRDIYEDIDRTDQTVLLHRKYMPSLTSRQKYNIGDINVPSCDDGFKEILDGFKVDVQKQSESNGSVTHGYSGTAENGRRGRHVEDGIITERMEAMAKILIDIWMSNLVDFATVLKIAGIVADESSTDRVVVVCYMGALHTRAIEDFYCNKMGFKKKMFVGKLNWEENEAQKIFLPSCLWNLEELFK